MKVSTYMTHKGALLVHVCLVSCFLAVTGPFLVGVAHNQNIYNFEFASWNPLHSELLRIPVFCRIPVRVGCHGDLTGERRFVDFSVGRGAIPDTSNDSWLDESLFLNGFADFHVGGVVVDHFLDNTRGPLKVASVYSRVVFYALVPDHFLQRFRFWISSVHHFGLDSNIGWGVPEIFQQIRQIKFQVRSAIFRDYVFENNNPLILSVVELYPCAFVRFKLDLRPLGLFLHFPVNEKRDSSINKSGTEDQPLNKRRFPCWRFLAVVVGWSPSWWGIWWWDGVYIFPRGRWGYILATSTLVSSWILCVYGS